MRVSLAAGRTRPSPAWRGSLRPGERLPGRCRTRLGDCGADHTGGGLRFSSARERDVTESRANAGPAICPTLLYADAKAAIRQLTEAFGFTEVVVHTDGDVVVHAELAHGIGVVMLGTKDRPGVFAQAMRGDGPSGVYVVVDDPDACHHRAVEHGVEILVPPTDQPYGARDFMARDLEGNVWSFGNYVPGTAG